MAGEPLIALRDVRKTFGEGEGATTALKGVSLEIRAGEFVALMGPSGSGKSTLMHILGFLDHVSEGTYQFMGEDVSGRTGDELARMRRHDVGFVFQAFHLLPGATVLENVMLPMYYTAVSPSQREERARKALEAVSLMHRVSHRANQLSGGEKQRAAIARAIVNDPAVLFADEPTGNLDSKSGTAVLELLQKLNAEGHTVIMVTHETEAAEFAQRIVRVKDGSILSDTTTHERRRGEYQK
jgi:ABC-type lipoprotein export system ATPase subunit